MKRRSPVHDLTQSSFCVFFIFCLFLCRFAFSLYVSVPSHLFIYPHQQKRRQIGLSHVKENIDWIEMQCTEQEYVHGKNRVCIASTNKRRGYNVERLQQQHQQRWREEEKIVIHNKKRVNRWTNTDLSLPKSLVFFCTACTYRRYIDCWSWECVSNRQHTHTQYIYHILDINGKKRVAMKFLKWKATPVFLSFLFSWRI